MNLVLILIILLNVVITYKGLNDGNFFRKYEFHIGSIKAGDQFRMFTSAFLHVDFIHFFFNMYTLYMFSPTVINQEGAMSFLLIYLGSLLFGNLLTLAFHKNDYAYRAVGASGAVTGVLFASILINPYCRIGMFPIPSLTVPGYIFGILYLLYSIYGIKAKSDNIGHTAHFGGAVGGLLIMLTKQPSIFIDKPNIVMCLAIPVIILFVLAKTGKI